jgi:putative hydrolase of the HAD superfamily
MIKAVCFDFFNTLSYYNPSREETYQEACARIGVKVELKNINKSLLVNDVYWREENHKQPYQKRSKPGQFLLFEHYVYRMINGSGVKISHLQASRIVMHLIHIKWDFVVFKDAVPTMKALRKKGITVGIVSNADIDFSETFSKLGLLGEADFTVTSYEAGCEKPEPGIFLLALKKTGVKPEEVLFVGDQLIVDVRGALNVGMKALMIDRNNWQEEVTECPRIQGLEEIEKFLES